MANRKFTKIFEIDGQKTTMIYESDSGTYSEFYGQIVKLGMVPVSPAEKMVNDLALAKKDPPDKTCYGDGEYE